MEHDNSYNVFYEIEKVFFLFALSPDFPYGTDFLCHTQLFEAMMIAKCCTSDFSMATYILFPSLFSAWSNVIFHLVLLVLFLFKISHKVQKYPLPLIRVI